MTTPAEVFAADKRGGRSAGRTIRRRKVVWVCTLKARRDGLGLSAADVGRAVGLSEAGVHDIEKGSNPTLLSAVMLAEFFGVGVKDLWPKRA